VVARKRRFLFPLPSLLSPPLFTGAKSRQRAFPLPFLLSQTFFQRERSSSALLPLVSAGQGRHAMSLRPPTGTLQVAI